MRTVTCSWKSGAIVPEELNEETGEFVWASRRRDNLNQTMTSGAVSSLTKDTERKLIVAAELEEER